MVVVVVVLIMILLYSGESTIITNIITITIIVIIYWSELTKHVQSYLLCCAELGYDRHRECSEIIIYYGKQHLTKWLGQ